MIRISDIDTPLGIMTAAATKEGVCLLEFGGAHLRDFQYEYLSGKFGMPVKEGENRHIRILKRQLKEYFRGKRKKFTVSLLTDGTDFQESAWDSLRKIPYGATISYQAQAMMLGNEGAMRAVAHANASNRLAILIPCHRVIGSDGSLTGYGGGLERKKWLIEHEKKFSGQPVDGTLF